MEKRGLPPIYPGFGWFWVDSTYIHRFRYVQGGIRRYGEVCGNIGVCGICIAFTCLYSRILLSRYIYSGYCYLLYCIYWEGLDHITRLLRESIIYKAFTLYITGSVQLLPLYRCFHIIYNVCPAFTWLGLSIEAMHPATHTASRANCSFQRFRCMDSIANVNGRYIYGFISYITILDAVYLVLAIKALIIGPYAQLLGSWHI